MMKYLTAVLAAVLLFIALALSASGAIVVDDWQSYSEIASELPEKVRKSLPPTLFDSDASNGADTLSELVGFDSMIARLLTAVKDAFEGHVKELASVLSMLLLCAIAAALSKSFEQFSSLFELCSCVIFSISLYSMVANCIYATEEYISELCVLVNSFMPVMAAIYFAGGNAAVAVVSGSSMAIFLNVMQNFCSVILLPILKVVFGFSLVSALSPVCDMSGITKLLKNSFTKILSFITVILSCVMTYQSSLASSADSLASRTVKFALGNMVPIVGGAVGDSVRTAAASISLIKSCAGVLGVVLLALLCLPPLAWCAVCRFELSFCAAAARLLGCKKECALIEELSGTVGFAFALGACCTVFFLYTLTLFIGFSLAAGA